MASLYVSTPPLFADSVEWREVPSVSCSSRGITMKTLLRSAPPVLTALLLALSLLAGCSVRVDKGKDGEDKKVKIDTPLGGIHVNTDKPQGSTGIAQYPGATLKPDHDGDKNADVELGFGSFQLKVKVEHYTTPDDRDKVMAFYRTALAKYGDVLECHGPVAVGSLKKTSEGLTCNDTDKHGRVHEDVGELTLRAGSRKRQHIVGFDKADSDNAAGPTGFALIALELPSDDWKKNQESD
jgi:hypothetical protein